MSKKHCFFILMLINCVFVGAQGALDLAARGTPFALITLALTVYAFLVGVALGSFT